LKDALRNDHGYEFVSECDTEVVSMLAHFFHRTHVGITFVNLVAKIKACLVRKPF
jgi:glucosamine 6-phosphate synthetase-like amidotransferase/phosphosugar isomerase protein